MSNITQAQSSNQLIINSEETTIYAEIRQSLATCISFNFNVAFINFGGIQLFVQLFDQLRSKGIRGKIITSDYLYFTDPKALFKIKEFKNIDLKVYKSEGQRGFHSKAYIFEYPENYKVIIGSANLTQSALKTNIEWNVQVVSKKNDQFIAHVLQEFKEYWDMIDEPTDEFFKEYENFIKILRADDKKKKALTSIVKTYIEPNKMQQRALHTLERQRQHGAKRSLIIAATGTGKTYLAALDVKQMKPGKVLFIVHRENILRQAMESFQRIIGQDIDCGLYTGTEKDIQARYLFATNFTMQRHYNQFSANEFDYIIIDEAHHATGLSYEKLMAYFTPKFMLGMTATPERSDQGDIFALFDHNVGLEVRLHEAMNEMLVVPFHYYGITDIVEADLSDVDIDNIEEVTKRLKINERVDYIIQQMRLYGHDGEKMKCLAFCVSVDHAEYMAEQFNRRMIPSVSLTGEASMEERISAMQRLEDDQDPLKIIFTRDIFNEGIDIPSINLVLMLRPTNSPIVFIQQLGRGLRTTEDKEFLTVLDFIGNHNRAFLIAVALKGGRYFDQDSLKVAVKKEFGNIPGHTFIQMDQIAKERILKQISMENFRKLRYLKEEYLAFKAQRHGKIPYLLMDYRIIDGSPDPIRFIQHKGTYLQFINLVEREHQIGYLLENQQFMKAMKYLSDMLPLRRPFEFLLLRYLLQHDSIHFLEARNVIQELLIDVDNSSVAHTMEYLNFDYYEERQKDKYLQFVTRNDATLLITQAAKELLADKESYKYIEDIIQYGLSRYFSEFDEENYGVPFFKLYEQYTRFDVALLANVRKIHTSYRDGGLITNGNDYFLFVNLHKNDDIKESFKFPDKLIDRDTFQWATPNNTVQNSERGKNIIHNQKRDINLHLFIRKTEQEKGVTLPFIYMGKINTFAYKNERPIVIQAHFEHKVPQDIFDDLVMKV